MQTIHLQIGQLRQIVPDTLAYCWELVTEQGRLAGSTLEIDHRPVVLDCRACGGRTTLTDVPVLTCAVCGSATVDLVSGDEFLVISLDLVEVS